MLIRCSILSSNVSSRNFLEVDTYRSRELLECILKLLILKGLCNFTQKFEMKEKANEQTTNYYVESGFPIIFP